MSTPPSTERKRLDSWKEIAEYVGRDVRTVMRWEQQGFPVRRVPGGQRRGVFALPSEIDAWMADREGEPLPDTPLQVPPLQQHRRRYVGIGLLLLIAIASSLGFYSYRQRSKVNRELVFHLGDATYRFEKIATIDLRGEHGPISIGDLNKDGIPDIIVGGNPTNLIAIILSRSEGGFQSPIFMKGCDESVGSVIGDFDRDSNLDLAIACFDSAQVQVWWGDGTGRFPSSTLLPVGGIEPIHCVLGDFNRDHIDDFVCDASGGGPISVFLSRGDRTFTRLTFEAGSNPQIPSVADFDGDGNLDLAIACYGAGCFNVVLLHGHGDGTFDRMQDLPSAATVYSLVAADLTGDNIPDIFVASLEGQTTLYQGLGGGKFLPPKLARRMVGVNWPILLPLDGRKLVLDFQYYPTLFALLQFNSRGEAHTSDLTPIDGTPHFIATADFDRDGRKDLAMSYMTGGRSYLEILLRR